MNQRSVRLRSLITSVLYPVFPWQLLRCYEYSLNTLGNFPGKICKQTFAFSAELWYTTHSINLYLSPFPGVYAKRWNSPQEF